MKPDKNVVLIRQGGHKGKLGVYMCDSGTNAVVLIGDPRETTHRIIISHDHIMDVWISPKLLAYLIQDA